MTDVPAFPTQIVRLSDQRARHDLAFRIEPDAGERGMIAEFLGIPAIRKLRFEGRLAPLGRRDWQLEGQLGATVVQDCVVTLAPVTTRIDETVIRRYLSDLPDPTPGEVEMPEDDTVENLPATLDLVSVMVEALSLALPPFPRAEGADLGEVVVTEPGIAPLTREGARPFSALESLRESLKNKGDQGSE